MRQIVGELYLRAFSVCAVVLKEEVHHPQAEGLEVGVFVPQHWVYSGPICCVLLALWWTRSSTRVFGVHSSGAPSLRAMAWTALVTAVTKGGKGGSATWATLPAAVG